ncbi:AimR family lysis-lysogeny pheromone receptor [Sediminibacillus massiliensis]|uniref:AimR family lysis-lysogeny pheromone receptor n=1 Tax=Sediminibacillus massiliensis TaxID=1926277 RepID=UPI0009885F07|nr:AimR family lysis-lysogeny pheromone receptor [Sediminibacillus massiliensis]
MKDIQRKEKSCNCQQDNKLNNLDRFFANGEEPAVFHVFQSLTETAGIRNAIDLTKDFCLMASSHQNRRTGMEFLYSYGFLEELDKLIDINRHSDNELNRRWGELYWIINERRKRNLNTKEYLKLLSGLELGELELQCLSDFLKVYAHFERKEYGMLGTYLDRLLLAVHEVQDPLLNELFSVRLDEIMLTYHWKRNEMIIARKYGYRILNTTHSSRKKIDIHNTMALGYLFDSYQQAIEHAREAKRIALQTEDLTAIQGVNNFTIPFISAYHGVTEGIETPVESETAHLALARGDYETCVRILAGFEQLSPFQQYYLGKALQDKNLLEVAYRRFIHERSDYFFARLPLLEIQRTKALS